MTWHTVCDILPPSCLHVVLDHELAGAVNYSRGTTTLVRLGHQRALQCRRIRPAANHHTLRSATYGLGSPTWFVTTTGMRFKGLGQ